MKVSNKKNSFLMGTLILGAAGVIIKILGAIFRIPLANFIGAEGMGYYQTAYPVYALFLTLATAGFPTAIAKLVSEQVALGNHKGANEIFKITHLMLFVTGLVTFLILFIGADNIVTNVQHNPNALTAMKAIAPALLIVPSMSAYRGYYQGYQQMSRIAISQIIEQIFRVFLGLALAFILMKQFGPKIGAAGGISGATIGAFASFIFLMLVYFKDSKQRKYLIENSTGYVKQDTSTIILNIVRVVIPISIGACVMPLVNVVDSVIVIARLKAAGFTTLAANSLLGQLTGMAMPIIVMPMIFTTAIGMSLVPAISESYTLKKFNEARHNAKMAFKITLLLVLPCAFGLASLAQPIMGLLFPKQSAEVVGLILFTLSPACIFLGLLYTFNGILQGMGKPMIPVYALLCGIAGKIVISYTLTAIPSINILGSAFGTVASYLIAAIFEYIYIKRALSIQFNLMDYFIKPLITVMLMFLGARYTYIGLSMFLGNKISTLFAIIVGGIIYVVVIIGIGGITQEEILAMPKGRSILAKLKKLKLVRG
ncbi:putative polysaccharide biosynthesis protein [Peptostreptococcus canis]|uniref:Polysaccharide biosynthesis protein n=1 Tax=Peptostreptococcus canis TaxID=1159213 RepID=A0ABR6TLR1_9FIRM|nr:polysaccharide biosynthesis protein [Peptostreptococcus canis]MBC2576334.1 polysaccharide biosynthesis protein [Peptostreptococcus canis]MBP1998533.1 stage V sporulation protein B [Peptostreptococcus canis]